MGIIPKRVCVPGESSDGPQTRRCHRKLYSVRLFGPPNHNACLKGGSIIVIKNRLSGRKFIAGRGELVVYSDHGFFF